MNINYFKNNIFECSKIIVNGAENKLPFRIPYKIKLILAFFVSMIKIIFISSKLEIPSVEIVLTTKCTLKCKDCANLMPYYKEHLYEEKEVLLSDIERFISAVDHIYFFTLIGGEPFLYKDIDTIVDYLVKSEKVSYVKIITNGTIIPTENVLKAIKNKKVIIYISDYKKFLPQIAKKQDDIIRLLSERNINYDIPSINEWYDTGVGNFSKRAYSTEETKKLYNKCFMKNCNTLLNGFFYMCSRGAHSMNLGFVKKVDTDFADVRKYDFLEIRDKIKYLYKKDFINACQYCDGSYAGCKKIVPVQQEE